MKLIIALIIGAIIAILGFFIYNQIDSNNGEKLKINAGSLTPNELSERKNLTGFSTISTNGVKIYYQSDKKTEAEYISKLLSTNPGNILTESDQVNIVLGGSVTLRTLNDLYSEYNLEKVDRLITSGNNIYLVSEEMQLLNEPSRAYENFFASLLRAKWFSTFDDNYLRERVEKNEFYSLDDVGIVEKYKSLAKVGEGQKWTIPYPEKFDSYKIKTPNCYDIESAANLLICELTLSINGNLEVVPPDTQKFIKKEFNTTENLLEKELNFTTKEDTLRLIRAAGGEISDLKYTNWSFKDFTKDSYKLNNQTYYEKVKSGELKEIRKAIADDGWSKVSTDSAKDSQFGMIQSETIYTKNKSDLIKEKLILREFNTSEMNSSCITEGVGKLFCPENKVILKNSGYYLQVLVGYKSNYENRNQS